MKKKRQFVFFRRGFEVKKKFPTNSLVSGIKKRNYWAQTKFQRMEKTGSD